MRSRNFTLKMTLFAVLALINASCNQSLLLQGRQDGSEAYRLTQDEINRAIAIAQVGSFEIASTSPEIIGAVVSYEFIASVARFPATDESDTRRLAAVSSIDYSTGQATRAIVDLRSSQLVDTKSVPGWSIPATPDELTRIRELLALDSAEYRQLFESAAENYDLAAFAMNTSDESDIAGHRIFLIRPVFFGSTLELPVAVIDLTMDRVVRYEN